MTSAQLIRISGLALVTGAAAFTVHVLLRSVLTAGTEPIAVYQQALWVPVSSLGVIGAVLVLLGLPGSYARIASAAGWLGLAGIALVGLAWMFFGLFLSLFSALVAPWMVHQPGFFGPALPVPTGVIVAFVLALIANLVGAILLAIPFLLYRAKPRWIGYVLPLSALWTVAGDLVAPGGPASNVVINLLSNLGVVLLLCALAGISAPVWWSSPLRSLPSGDAGEGSATVPSLQGGAGEGGS